MATSPKSPVFFEYEEEECECTNPSPKKKLENDLRRLLYDERFYDISLKCSDNVILHASKNILASRSEVFNDHIFDKSKTTPNQQLEFDDINSIAMKLILEYLYTSRNEKEMLEFDKIIEVYYSSIHFKLDDLQKDVIEFTNKTLREENEDSGKNLLSQLVEKFTLKVDNKMSKLLIDWVAKIQLFPEDADKDSLSLMGLQHLLDKTYETDKSFATYELALFEYTLVKTKQIISEDRKTDPYDMSYDSDVIERIKERLKPLLPRIDLRIINSDIVVKDLEPLKLFPPEMITNVYRYKVEKKDKPIQPMRGHIIFKWKNFEKESKESKEKKSENELQITNNGFTVEANSNLKKHKSVFGNLIVKNNGIHKWDIKIDNLNDTIYVGICGINDQFEKPDDRGFGGWALGSDGCVYLKNNWKRFGVKFKEGDVISVTVNMEIKHCFFSVNEVTNYDVFGHAFPDEVYPFVTLNNGGKLHVKAY